MEYMSVAEAAQKWGLTPRNVQIHCEKGNIPDVTWIFETKTIGNVGPDVPVDDIVETANHFRAVDKDGNGRVGRLILLKECLKHNITPFVIAENFKQFYYLGLQDWRRGRHARLMDTCRTGQDVFILGLRQFGHTKLAEKAEAEQKVSERQEAK